LFLHAVVGFGLFIYFTAELVGSAAKPPTAFSTIQGTFPQRVVRWLAGIVDWQPDILKAVMLLIVVISGLKGFLLVMESIMWGIVYLAVKAI